MGREIRRVVPNWEHPKDSGGRYIPMFDESCEEAWAEWHDGFREWNEGEHAKTSAEYGEDQYPLDQPYASYCKWHGEPPTPDSYRPHWKAGDATWWQVYETVTEGTPVTPAFATADELIVHLVNKGEAWGGKWTREQAESFVLGSGWAPSLVVAGGKVMSGVEAMHGKPTS